jgi:hypothetical protein
MPKVIKIVPKYPMVMRKATPVPNAKDKITGIVAIG